MEDETNDFGVPWFHQLLDIGATANNAAEAVEIITKGTPEYRTATGRQTILQGSSWYQPSPINSAGFVACSYLLLPRLGS